MTVVTAVLQTTLATPAHPSSILAEGARYLDWGVIQISLTNFLIVIGMVVLFVLALVVPFPHSADDRTGEGHIDVAK